MFDQRPADGPLLAELWLIRSVEDGAATHAREIGSPAAMRHILAAQSVAGASAFVRCWAHLALANEWALDGEGHGALIDRDCAAYDADHALSSPFAAPVDDIGAWFAGSRGAVLRKLGRWADTEAALQSAGSRGIVSDVYGAVEWAPLRLATGDADAAPAHLAAALDTCHLSASFSLVEPLGLRLALGARRPLRRRHRVGSVRRCSSRSSSGAQARSRCHCT